MKHKLIMFFGILLIIFGGFGYGYTYMIDHRTADNLSAYCDIDFKTDVDEKGVVSTANLTILDYRFDGSRLKPALLLICDGDIFDMQASVRQTPPSYSIAFYNNTTTLKNTNKLFAEFPADSFDAIRNAQVIRIRFAYSNGDTVELPLNEQDLQYWKEQMDK